ncbi:MAG: rod shape-determining protein MreC [Agathobacter sp.]|nr:rod shape-determining protein MreC [Agathobacter sp.]
MKKIRNRNSKKKQIETKYMLIALTVVCVLGIFGGLVYNINGGPLKAIAGYIFVPMQQGINATGSWIFNTANDFKTLSQVLEENEKLKEQNAELTNQLTIAKIEQYELENLRELFDLSEKYPTYEKVAANVIAKDSGNWFSSFTINRGEKDGIMVGMNVLADGGLVGIVTDVGPNYSKVRSIIDDANNVSAMVPSTGDNFNVSGNLKTMNEAMVITFSELRDAENSVKIGEPVITSYVSDQYHQGILIGYISSIEFGPNNLTKIGTITPVADFEHLEDVLVIKKIKDVGNTVDTEPTE